MLFSRSYSLARRHRRLIINGALLILALCPLARAQGGPPLLTDDPGTPGNGNWEINVGVADEGIHGRHRLEVPILDLNYGAGDRVQLKYEVPWLLETGNGPTYTEAGNSLMGVKWRFLDQEKRGVDVSTYPQLSVSNPGSQRIVERNVEFLLPLEVVRTRGKLQVDGEAGYNFRQHGLDEWLFGFATGYQAFKKQEWIGELHAVALRDFSETEFLFHVGFRRELTKRYSLLFAIGRGLPGSLDRQPGITGYVGLQVRLGRNAQHQP